MVPFGKFRPDKGQVYEKAGDGVAEDTITGYEVWRGGRQNITVICIAQEYLKNYRTLYRLTLAWLEVLDFSPVFFNLFRGKARFFIEKVLRHTTS